MPAHSSSHPAGLLCCRCPRVASAWQPDGDLAKPVWSLAPHLELNQATTGAPAGQRSVARALWDGDHLYLGFECEDEEIFATFTQRDDKVWQEEAVEAFLAPYGDLRHYFEFQCSPTNVVRDVRVTNPNARAEGMSFDGAWDCPGWQTAVAGVQTTDGRPGWCAEWRIPLRALLDDSAGPVLPGEEWRFNLFRIDRRPREEYLSWSPTPGTPFSFHRPHYFGRLIFS